MNIAEPSISLTDAAALRVNELIQDEKNPNLKLRVYIKGGGCSGFQYGFAFDEDSRTDDTVVEKKVGLHNVFVVIDVLSLMYLKGAMIDYKESLQGAHFTVINPNAGTTCSCGSSFSLA